MRCPIPPPPKNCLTHAQRTADSTELRAAVDTIERIFHGNPSGLDALLAETGQLGLFTRAEGLRTVQAARPVRLIIAEPNRERQNPEFVAEKTGARVLLLPIMPGGGEAADYVGLIDYNVRQVAAALKTK